MSALLRRGPRDGLRLRDDRYGTVFELVSPTGPLRLAGIATCEVDPGARSPLHVHQITEETYFILDGAGTMVLGDEEVPIGPGDTVLIPPGLPHAIEAGPAGVKLLVVTAPPYDVKDDQELE
jgi:mannose-6-phosphate isomerase-like protein (cupin superfamily)